MKCQPWTWDQLSKLARREAIQKATLHYKVLMELEASKRRREG